MRKRRAFLTLCLIVGFVIISCVLWRELAMGLRAIISPSQLHCYWSRSRGIIELGRGEWDEPMLVPSRCIFFHETTCSSPILTAQQACAVESAATTNRNLNIFLLLFASGKFSGKSKSLAKILETYSNVYIRRARLSTYVIDTPIEDWFSANIWSLSDNRVWLYRDLHDYIRMLTLWKFGGVALNLNGVVQASLEELTTFVGVRSDRDKDIGVFGVDTSTDFGREFVNVCMEIVKNTDATNYVKYNITNVITEALQKLCYQQKNKKCRQFTVYPPARFYPVYSWENGTHDEKMQEPLQNATTIHLEANYNRDTLSKADNIAAYRMAAKQHCPKIYEFAAEDF